MGIKVTIRVNDRADKKNKKKEFKCDCCGRSSLDTKMYRKKNFPFGRKSKPTYKNKCIFCKNPKTKLLRITLCQIF